MDEDFRSASEKGTHCCSVVRGRCAGRNDSGGTDRGISLKRSSPKSSEVTKRIFEQYFVAHIFLSLTFTKITTLGGSKSFFKLKNPFSLGNNSFDVPERQNAFSRFQVQGSEDGGDF